MSLNELQTDALTEIVNIGVGRAASSLSELLDEHIQLSVPRVEVVSPEELSRHLAENHEPLDTTVIQDFSGSARGRAMLAFPRASAVQLGQIVGGGNDTGEELTIDLRGIVEEIGNIMLNGVLGTIANFVEGRLEFSVPELWTDVDSQRLTAAMSIDGAPQIQVVIADAQFSVSDRPITGSLILVFQVDEIQRIVDTMLSHTSST